MKRVTLLSFAGLIGSLLLFAHGRADDAHESLWLSWRGPHQSGVAPQADPPLEWSAKKNIHWKVAIAGLGHSTPIVLDDRVVVTTAVPVGPAMEPKYSGREGAHDNLPVTHRHKFVALAYRRSNGQLLWEKKLHETVPHEGAHYTASLASHSPVSDGKYIVTSFGSHGIFCLDINGNVVWHKQLGKMATKHGHGEGSSPVLHEQTVVVNWDHEEASFIVAFDLVSGKEQWRRERQEVTSWATPIVVEHDGTPQLIVSGTSRVRGYDLSSGKTLWECGGMSANIVASPVAGHGMVFAGSSYEKRALLAIDLDGASGDITDTKKVRWNRFRGTPYVPSPLLYGDGLYFLTHYQAIMTRVDATTGADEPGAFRLAGLSSIYASPVGAGDRVYVTDLEGTTLVLSHGKVPRMLALNRLEEPVSASAAIAGKEIYIRGDKHLYCIREHPE